MKRATYAFWVISLFLTIYKTSYISSASTPMLAPSYQLTTKLFFTKKPLIGKDGELVYQFTRGGSVEGAGTPDAVNVNAEVVIPSGFTLVAGTPTWSGQMNPGETHKTYLSVKPTEQGYFRFKSLASIGDRTSFTTEKYGSLWVEVLKKDLKINSQPQNRWVESKWYKIASFSDMDKETISPNNPLRFTKQSNNANKNIESSLSLSSTLSRIGDESTIMYHIIPSLDTQSRISIDLPMNAFSVTSIEAPVNFKIENKNSKSIVWSGNLFMHQAVDLKVKVKLMNYGWGQINASVADRNDVLNLYVDKYGKHISLTGFELAGMMSDGTVKPISSFSENATADYGY